jgi:trimeric autotransporter adhesin
MKKKILSTSLFLWVALAAMAQQNVSYNINNVPIGGTYNTALGFQSLTAVTGWSNSAVGYQALNGNTAGAYNTAMGHQAMFANTSGIANAGYGYRSLMNNVSGGYNSATGMVSLTANTTGSNNSASGVAALYSNTTGSGNTALGYYADVTVGNLSNATAIGNEAKVGASNTIQLGNNLVTAVYAGTGTTAKLIAGGLQIVGGTPSVGKVLTSDAAGNATWQVLPSGGGSWSVLGNSGTVSGTNFIGTTDNVAFDFRVNNQPAGRIDIASNGNTFFGYRSGNTTPGAGAWCTAIGCQALQSNAGGIENSAVGYQAMYSNTIGQRNTSFGNASLYSNTTGVTNTAIGNSALYNTTSGSYNTATGGNALSLNTTGSYNTATGFLALELNLTGGSNTSMGRISLNQNSTGSFNAAYGSAALLYNTSGNQNTATGTNALYDNAIGSNNSALGYYANVSVNNLNNATVLGANAVVNASNKVRIGNATVTVVEGAAPYTWVSDGRFKNNISADDVKGLEFITKLRPVVYNLDTRKFQEFLTKNMADSVRDEYLKQDFTTSSAIRQSGFIAQEVEKAAQEIGYDFNGVHAPADENDNYSLSYSQFVVPLVKGMQEQQVMIEAQNAALEQQQAQIAALQKLVADLVAASATLPTSTKSPSDQVSSNAIAVYPNPTGGIFTVYTQTLDQGTLEITNAAGTVIQRLELVRNTFSYSVDLSGQAKGLYLVSVASAGKVITQKVMVD